MFIVGSYMTLIHWAILKQFSNHLHQNPFTTIPGVLERRCLGRPRFFPLPLALRRHFQYPATGQHPGQKVSLV
jgi:hypothetical protein